MKVFLMFLSFVILSFTPAVSGTSTFQIRNCTELQQMSDNLVGHYVLMNDIDCSDTINWNNGKGFNPIGRPGGVGKTFIGSFDGQNHVVRNIYINRPEENAIGLFGAVNSTGLETTEINNVGLMNVYIVGKDAVGSLVGSFFGDSSISKCFAWSGIVNGQNRCGGLIGEIAANQVIRDSYASVNVCSTYGAGGLVGDNNGSEIISSYASGDVFGGGYVGGLVGYDNMGHETYRDCFAVGRVYRNGNLNQDMVGGFLGSSPELPTIMNSYWLSHTDDCALYCVGGYDHECNANAKTTICYFMRADNEPMASWDFSETWALWEKRTLPYLKWQSGSFKKIYSKHRRHCKYHP